MTIEEISIAGVVAERPATSFDGGTEIRITLAKPSTWPDDAQPGISVRQFVVSVPNGSEQLGRKRKTSTYIGPTRSGLPLLGAHDASQLAYALLAAVEEIEGQVQAA